MNGFSWSGPHGPMVRTLSGQVSGAGPFDNSRTNSGPNATPPTKSGVAWPGPFQIINPKTHDMNRSQNG